MSDKKPHKAVILLKIEVHELLPTGECSAKLVDPKDLYEHGLKPSMLLSVDGFDKYACLKNLKDRIDEFARR